MQSPERYTLAGPDEVERRIARDQQRVVDEVAALTEARRRVALVLAGGYGRGEGGFRLDVSGAVPYNDYDYFLVVRGCSSAELRSLRASLHALGERLGREFSLEVDFAVLESERLAKLPACLMYSELKWRHRVLEGDARALGRLNSPAPWDLPLAEFSRLMLNRGALLLMNSQALQSGAGVRTHGSERFLRYFSKGLLAAGDARLAAVGQYHPSVAERYRRLQDIEWIGTGREGFLDLYGYATHVKLGGVSAAGLQGSEPRRLHRLAVHEWLEAYRILESARLGQPLSSWPAYASPSVAKGQGSRHWWRTAHHLALALQSRRSRLARLAPARWVRHPRERLMAALPLLLEAGTPCENRLAAEALGAPGEVAWGGLTELFLADWRRYC